MRLRFYALICAIAFAAVSALAQSGTQSDPRILNWDTESFAGPSAGASMTYYQLDCNYEGVLTIKSDLTDVSKSEITVNGVSRGQVCDRDLLISRRDIIVFGIACESNNTSRHIHLSYRSIGEGEIWNWPIALYEGANLIAEVHDGINLARWYKVSIGSKEKLKIEMTPGDVLIFTPDNAARENMGETLTNNGTMLEYNFKNENTMPTDLYIKVADMAQGGIANVTLEKELPPAPPEPVYGTIDNPYILDPSTESFKGPKMDSEKTYYKMTSDTYGVLSIDMSNIKGQVVSDLIINNERIDDVRTREVMINRWDEITFAIACLDEDNSDNDIRISFRSLAEGETWDRAMALTKGDNKLMAIDNATASIPRWYLVSVPAGFKLTLHMTKSEARIFSAENAEKESSPIEFTELEDMMVYKYANVTDSPVEFYIKVTACPEGYANVAYLANEIAEGKGTADNPYILVDEARSFLALEPKYAKTYYQTIAAADGVMSIDTKAIKGQTATDLIVNGMRRGNVTSRDLLVSKGDTVLFAVACELDNTANRISFSYRDLAEGESCTQPLSLSAGENRIDEVVNNINIPLWYVITVPAENILTIKASNYGIYSVYADAEKAANDIDAEEFTNKEDGTIFYEFTNPSEDSEATIYIKITSCSSMYLDITLELPEPPAPPIPDAISSVTTNASPVIHDLSGRRTDKLTKGRTYIINGKKILKQ